MSLKGRSCAFFTPNRFISVQIKYTGFRVNNMYFKHKTATQYALNLSRVVRKPAFCICENKDADQLLAIFCGCTARFVWDLVGNVEDRISHNKAHFTKGGNKMCYFPQRVFGIELHRKKTCLQSFLPGPTQTWLYNHRRWLEA